MFSDIWDLMRTAAIARHLYLNQMFENSCPKKWALHMAVVRGFYGY
jgi:hypothetical protein